MASCDYVMCEQCDCGGNALSMSTSNPNPAVCQNVCGGKGCGGASNLSDSLNAIGKWGTVLTASLQGKPVVVNKSGVAVGAKGSTALTNRMSGNSMLLILVIVGVLIFMATRK